MSTTVYHSIKDVGHASPIEVQCSTFGGKIHIATNENSEFVIPGLKYFFKEKAPGEKSRPNISHAKSRYARHSAKLKIFVANSTYFHATRDLGAMEVREGRANDDRLRINPEFLARQFEFGMDLLRRALMKAANEDFSLIEVHSSPLALDSIDERRAARHAERSIVDYLAKTQDKMPGFATELGITPLSPIIIPMEGRFVPCALCYAFEDAERTPNQGGLFDPKSSILVLYRSTKRAGKFYWNEDQILSIRGLAKSRNAALDCGSRIIHEMVHAGGGVTAGMHYTPDSALNTDSDSD
ncbi:hypothetical protein OHC51_03505 [Stenotrophomonas indicatrix]|uniref:hypothetical protein n=1 Tax=Stenotrophomonas indicatrix TaxID=2045451 RepID=UPI00300B2295